MNSQDNQLLPQTRCAGDGQQAGQSSARRDDQLRQVSLHRRYTCHAEGSVLVSFGQTKVLCCASIEDRVPVFSRVKAQGWVTAEYGMLPDPLTLAVTVRPPKASRAGAPWRFSA